MVISFWGREAEIWFEGISLEVGEQCGEFGAADERLDLRGVQESGFFRFGQFGGLGLLLGGLFGGFRER